MKKSTETGESYYRSVAETGNPAYRSAGYPPPACEVSGTTPYLNPPQPNYAILSWWLVPHPGG